MITTLICDDEPLARQLLREYLVSHADHCVVGECASGEAAVLAIESLQPDLVLMDIQMPGLTGLEVLALTGRQQGVIFTTAFDHYALQAFDVHAVDYLLKPFSQRRFDAALHRARNLQGQAQPGLQAWVAAPKPYLQRLVLRERQQVQIVPLDSVLAVQAQDDYILIHTEQRHYLKTQSLADLQAQLDPAHFVRLHRSWIVHLPHLLRLERTAKDARTAVLRNGLRVPVSRSGQEQLRSLL